MARLSFQDLAFSDGKAALDIRFYTHYRCSIPHEDLVPLGPYTVEPHAVTFPRLSDARASRRFAALLEKAFSYLTNTVTGKRTVYVHRNSGIPLIGSGAFGIIDRGTRVLEMKPITGCNIGCVFCSVDEGQRQADFVVEADYLADEARKVIAFKGAPVELHINCQGEPLLYAPLAYLVARLREDPLVARVVVETNGMMLTPTVEDRLIQAGVSQFNISLNAMDPTLARRIADAPYRVGTVKATIGRLAKKVPVMVTPVWVPGLNDAEIDGLVAFCKEHGVACALQNYLEYRFGRKAGKEKPFEDFYAELRELERRHGVRLILDFKDGFFGKGKALPKPFKKGDVVRAEIVCEGRLKGERIAASQGRAVSVMKCPKEHGQVVMRITRSKHNIYVGTPVRSQPGH
ncbi:radical SAM protein [Candidatus Woesearchaeota archaeon]|nr:radical SAM protein [Candidatus Woesearchaeota archaeon]